MALTNCPECRREVSDRAVTCPGCGHPLTPQVLPQAAGGFPFYWGGYEFKSKTTILGLPLVHIVRGYTPGGRIRVAKGFIAIGNIAVGVIALGAVSLGVFSFAGAGIGVVCLAGVAFGLFCGIGGVAVGYLAIGGVAVGIYAVGGLALGPHTIYNDPNLLRSLENMFHL